MNDSDTQRRQMQAVVPEEMVGRRLDQALAELFPEYSRSRLQQWVKDGEVLVDGRQLRAKDKLLGGELVKIDAEITVETPFAAEPIPLTVIYEDESVLVINKPAGLVVHPAVGNWQGTLLNALLHHAPQLELVPRAGIVHRLDKDTTGLLVVAKTLEAQTSLVEQLQARSFTREYDAVINGVLTGGGKVDAPMGRHPSDRKRMAVVRTGKPAVTHYRLVRRFRAHSQIKVQLETGRTHQIRVHMAHLRHPLIGDPVYGGRLRIPPASSEVFAEALRRFPRQALHAARLGFEHPTTAEYVEWEVDMPEDMQGLLQVLEQDLLEHEQ